MNIKEFQEINKKRSLESFPECENWELGDWGNALAGEVGELCNFIKKIRRIEVKATTLNSDMSMAELTKAAGKEMGDVMSYLANIASELNLDLEKETVDKFNLVSEILDSKYRLETTHTKMFNACTWKK
tara:strand:+ start:554 stop:940 length:387 start_codon:yes stop_codon:yes gene_type:complete